MSTYNIYTGQFYSNVYLMHHGIKGMHWGVRRFETAAGRLTDAGKRRYSKINGEYQKRKQEKAQRKQEKQNSRKESLDNIKAKLTSPEAKKAYKNIAKGTAIAAALLATGVTMNAVKDNADFKKDVARAKQLTDEIMSDNFKKMSSEKRKVIYDTIRDTNIQNLQQDRRNAARAKKQLIKDTARGYASKYNPKTRDSSTLDSVRLRRTQGGYSGPDTTINRDNISRYKKGLKRRAQEVVDPEKFERKRKKKQEKAQRKYEASYKARYDKMRDDYYKQYGIAI